MSEAKGQKKKSKGLLNSKRRKLTAGEADLAALRASAAPADGAPRLMTVPDGDLASPEDRRYCESAALGSPGDQDLGRFNTDILSSAQRDQTERSKAHTLGKDSASRFERDPLSDDDLEARPIFAHDASVSTDAHGRRKKDKGKKGGRKEKPRKPTAGTINKGGARPTTGGACCAAGGDACSIF